jgi:hypothetical protein
MPTVAKNIVHRPEKLFHPYQVLINRKKKGEYFSRVYATLEEAIVGRDAYLASVKNGSLNTTIVNHNNGVE